MTQPAVRRVLAVGAFGVLLAGCGHFGGGVATLPAGDGWQPLPVRDWLTNDGLEPGALVVCPPAACARPAVALLFSAEGDAARALEANLADTAALLRGRPRPKPRTIGGKPAPEKTPRVRSATRISRGIEDGRDVTRAVIMPEAGIGRAAFATIFSWQEGARRRYALAVTTDADAADRYARAILESAR